MDYLNWKAALFDLDGTLLDTEGQYSSFWEQMGKDYHPEIDDFAQRIKGTTLTDILQRYFPDEKVRVSVVNRLDDWETNMQYRFFPGAWQFVEDIRRHGVRTAVVTSSNQNKMKAMTKCHPQFAELFDSVLTAEMFPASKPNPSCYLLGARTLDASLEQCVVFEDAMSGLLAGMRSGMFTVGLTTTLPEPTVRQYCHLLLPSFEGLSYDIFVSMMQQQHH